MREERPRAIDGIDAECPTRVVQPPATFLTYEDRLGFEHLESLFDFELDVTLERGHR